MKKKMLAGLATGLFMFGVVGTVWATSIQLSQFSLNSITIDFEDVNFSSPDFGNAALNPITDYTDQGVTFYVHNQDSHQGTIHDVFRLGGWVSGEGVAIATNVGEGASVGIELVFSTPVLEIGALVAVSNSSLSVFNGNILLEQSQTANVDYSSGLTHFIGIHNDLGITRALFTDIDLNGLIMAIDNVTFSPVPEPATMLLFGTGLAGLGKV